MFPFDDDPRTACIVCTHVLNKEEPITYISHDLPPCSIILIIIQHLYSTFFFNLDKFKITSVFLSNIIILCIMLYSIPLLDERIDIQ